MALHLDSDLSMEEGLRHYGEGPGGPPSSPQQPPEEPVTKVCKWFQYIVAMCCLLTFGILQEFQPDHIQAILKYDEVPNDQIALNSISIATLVVGILCCFTVLLLGMGNSREDWSRAAHRLLGFSLGQVSVALWTVATLWLFVVSILYPYNRSQNSSAFLFVQTFWPSFVVSISLIALTSWFPTLKFKRYLLCLFVFIINLRQVGWVIIGFFKVLNGISSDFPRISFLLFWPWIILLFSFHVFATVTMVSTL
jgi:hypothetical protein